MIREKIINWNPLTEKPTIEKDDEFVVGDSGVNQITLKVDSKYDNYQAQMVLSRLNSNVGYLDLQVVTGGKAIFKVPSEFINLGVSVVYFRLAQNGEVITSCGYKYTISCGKIYSEIKINSTSIDELLKELNETITKASNTNELLTTTTGVANQVDTKLEDTITEGKSLQTDLDSRNAQAIVNVADLSNSNSIASKNITNLKSENAEADSNILDLNNANTTASQNISGLNSENSEAKTNASNLETQNNASITNASTLTSENLEATSNIRDLNNANTVAVQNINVLKDENKKADSNMANLGNANVAAIQNVSNLDVKNLEATNNIRDLETQNNAATTNVSNLNSKNSEAVVNLQNLQNKIDEVPLKIQDIETIGDAQVERVKNTGSISTLDKNTLNYFTEWLGTKTEYDAIPNKSADRRYSIYSDTGEITEQYYFKWIEPKDFFDSRISLVFKGSENGIYMYNDPNDPMSIKTMNNNGLQVLEEVPGEYKIYIDKDAVMTTVAKYAPGSYQTFMDRKADVDNSRSLLKGYNIEWTQQDDSDLFIQCNNETISKIENQPMTLNGSTQPVVLEPKTVPTTYECCFRVGKKAGEIYIGEGYENLGSSSYFGNENTRRELIDNNTIRFELLESYDGAHLGGFTWSQPKPRVWSCKISTDKSCIRETENSVIKTEYGYLYIQENPVSTYGHQLHLSTPSISNVGDIFTMTDIMVTETSTPKPFVKSVMPSGKLAFVTLATSETHSFVMKGRFGYVTSNLNAYRYFYQTDFLQGSSNEICGISGSRYNQYDAKEFDWIVGKNYSSALLDGNYSTNEPILNQGMSGGVVNVRPVQPDRIYDSFKQFLIYKANLTEAELKAELAKDIKLR